MNTGLFTKNVPVGATGLNFEVKANSSRLVDVSELDAKKLLGLKQEHIIVSVASIQQPARSSDKVIGVSQDGAKGIAQEAPEEPIKKDTEGVSEEGVPKVEDIDSLDLEQARKMCDELGIKYRANYSRENLIGKIKSAKQA